MEPNYAEKARVEQELTQWLDTQSITSDNIGDIRRSCFMPWSTKWNGLVRAETAARENKPAKSPESAAEQRGAEDEETVLTIKLPISIKAFGAVEEGLRKQYGTLYLRPAGEGLICLVKLRTIMNERP